MCKLVSDLGDLVKAPPPSGNGVVGGSTWEVDWAGLTDTFLFFFIIFNFKLMIIGDVLILTLFESHSRYLSILPVGIYSENVGWSLADQYASDG